jgi:uncharacterized protein YcfJ
MNKSMLMGAAFGVAIATAGGVIAGYQYFGKDATIAEQGSAAVADMPEVVAEAAPPAAASMTAATRSAPAAPRPRATSAQAAPAQAVAQEECWDEVVTESPDVKDEHQIAGTALGAVVGGAVARDVGDRDLTTAVGAAVGAAVGNRLQKKLQERRQEKNTVTTTVRRCAPAGTPH